MKRFTLLVILLPLLLACERRPESASTTPAQTTQATPQPTMPQPTTQATQQPTTPSIASTEPAPAHTPAPLTTAPTAESAAPARPGQTSGSSGDYTVSKGDTLSSIAQDHGLNRQDVAKWNNIKDPNRIYPGQTLKLTEPNS